MIECRIDRAWRARARSVLELPLPASVVWGQMRDLRRFLTLDPLHVRIEPVGKVGARRGGWAGQEILISHRLLGIGPDRRGRVLRWAEGSGYAISDLSRRGRRVGFPHVCTYRVDPAGPEACRVTIGVRGVWTARWIPRWAAGMWIRWVLRATDVRVRREMCALARWRRGPDRGARQRMVGGVSESERRRAGAATGG